MQAHRASPTPNAINKLEDHTEKLRTVKRRNDSVLQGKNLTKEDIPEGIHSEEKSRQRISNFKDSFNKIQN